MNFLTLHDCLLSILFEDEDIIAIDKPYGLNAHTNDCKIEHSEFIQDGLIELYEKHLNRKLHIIHRLDQTTTGVMIFGKSTESAKKYAEFFFNRQVKKTYLFITQSKSKKANFLVDNPITHKGRELDAKTQLNLLTSNNGFELWQANPFTGRNHQIRIHARLADIPILGDTKYGGAHFPFLCLHNQRIEFPNRIIITSTPPAYFENLLILKDQVITRTVFEIDRRVRLYGASEQVDQCFRMLHFSKNSKELGFTMDHLGKLLVVQWTKESWSSSDFKRFTFLAEHLKKSILIRFSSHSQKQIFICGEPSPTESAILPKFWTAQENKICYEFRSNLGHSVGLSLNQRLHRNWVLNNSKNKSVLNLFCHTGGFSLAAALGKATQIISVDSNKNNLNWARKNFELNQIDPAQFIFLCRDSMSYLEQCRNKNLKFDLIICEAPSFLRQEKGVFKIESDIEKLLKSCIEGLAQEGELLFSTTFDGFFIQDIKQSIFNVQHTLKSSQIEMSCILPGLDFELPDEKAHLKSFLIRAKQI
jgi:23S rRNA (cytosine1962-C5)-methyltransferase